MSVIEGIAVKECIDSIESLVQHYDSFLSRSRDLAYQAARKLGCPDWIEGMAYNQRLTKKNGRSYAVLVLYRESGSRRVISLGPIEKFSKDRLYEVLKEKYGLTREEVNALLYVRFLKDMTRVLDRLKYHATRVLELSNDIKDNPEEFIDNLINQVKTDYRVAVVW